MLVLSLGEHHPAWVGGSGHLAVVPGSGLAATRRGGGPQISAFIPVLCFCVFSSCPPSSSPCHRPCSLLLPQVPSAPRRFRVRQPNLETIHLEWDHPEHPNGILTGYTLKYVACTFCPSFSWIIWESGTPSHHFS